MQPAAGLPQGNPELEAVWKLLQFSWHRHYQGLWQALQGYPWSPQLQPLVESLTIKTREHLMDLISTAYATVTPSKVAMLCGLTEAEALSGGWVLPRGVEHSHVKQLGPHDSQRLDQWPGSEDLSSCRHGIVSPTPGWEV